MMIKIENEFLEFDGDIEIEKQIKLFEEISTTDGDFSYSFEIQKTITNTKLLGNPMPDNISKPVYQKIEATILSNSGAETFKGYIRIERITDEAYQCSFFAGNNNWFGMLSGPLSDIDFSEYDTDLTQVTIQDAIFATEGVVFPLVDNGALHTRGNAQLRVEDFVAGIFVKDVFRKIFNYHGIKIQGELLNEPQFQTAITLSNGKSQTDIDASSSYVENSTGTSRPVEITHYKMDFQNDSVYPFYDGAGDAFDLPNSLWRAPYKMEIEVVVTYVFAIADSSYSNRIYIYINGVFTFVDVGLDIGGLYNTAYVGDEDNMSMTRRFVVEAGDTVEVYTEWQQSVGSTQNDVVSGTFKITPLFIYKSFGRAIVPPWTQQEYVSNILSCFNTLTFYNAKNRTLTFNLFEKINSHPAVDLSEYIESIESDFTELVSNYAKQNLLSHEEIEEDDFRPTRLPYSKGEIIVDNDFLDDSADIIESKFSNPISYINQIFDMSIERTNLLALETAATTEATGVTDSSFVRARFAIADDIFQIFNLVRIEDSTEPSYNGDWKVYTLGAGYVEFTGLRFMGNATAKLTILNFKYTESNSVFLLHHVTLYSITKFSGLPSFKLENTDISTWAFAFFNLLNMGRPVNQDFIYSMSFANNSDNEFQYQVSLIDQYFRLFKKVLNDPVKLFAIAHLPYHIYEQIDFLSPVQIKTLETTNQYYLNRITGYKESFLPCTLELIKI